MEFNTISSSLVRLALDAALLKHDAISSNIANVSSTDYSPLAVNFEKQLATHKAALLNRSNDSANQTLLGNVRPTVEQLDVEETGKVAVDMEMVKLNKNTVHYKALLEGLGKNMSIIKMAIREGR